jgi:hypothetical protein
MSEQRITNLLTRIGTVAVGVLATLVTGINLFQRVQDPQPRPGSKINPPQSTSSFLE